MTNHIMSKFNNYKSNAHVNFIMEDTIVYSVSINMQLLVQLRSMRLNRINWVHLKNK